MSITKVTRSITNHNYLILNIDDILHVIHQRTTSRDHCIDFFHIILGIIITTGLREYMSLVLNHLDPNGKLFTYRLYHNACCYTRDNRLVKDSTTTSRPWDHVVIANDNPTIYALQPENTIPVALFIKTDNDQEPP
jgi:TFIIF-interacting CTD phosphatase-like protein